MKHGAVELNNQTVSYIVSITVVKADRVGGRGGGEGVLWIGVCREGS